MLPAISAPIDDHGIVTRGGSPPAPPVCTENLNADVMVMKSAKDGERLDAPSPLGRAEDRRILVKG
jgi:hypothetical protein